MPAKPPRTPQLDLVVIPVQACGTSTNLRALHVCTGRSPRLRRVPDRARAVAAAVLGRVATRWCGSTTSPGARACEGLSATAFRRCDPAFATATGAWTASLSHDSTPPCRRTRGPRRGPACSAITGLPIAAIRRLPDIRACLRKPELSECSPAEIVNSYDNAILYTDHVWRASFTPSGENGSQRGPHLPVRSRRVTLEAGIYLHGLPYGISRMCAEVPRGLAVRWPGADGGSAVPA